MGFRHLSIGKDLVNEADIFLQLRLPGADGLTQIFQLRNLLFCLGNLFLPLLNHAVIPLCICFIPDSFHQNILHFFFHGFYFLT